MTKSSSKIATGSGPEVISLIFQIRNSAYMKSEKLGVSFWKDSASVVKLPFKLENAIEKFNENFQLHTFRQNMEISNFVIFPIRL